MKIITKIIAFGIAIVYTINKVYCDLYIDLRSNYISEGVVVYHGRFKEYGKYRMFVGGNEPLKGVYYDTKMVYPPYFGEVNDYDLFVEVFETKHLFYVLIHALTNVANKGYKYSRIYIQYGYHLFKRISYRTFINRVNFVVYLSVDVGKEKAHPFITKKIDELNPGIEIYRVVNKFDNKGIDTIEGPAYTFGYVYDSTKPIVIGYTKMNVFINSCESFEIDKRDSRLRLRFMNGNTVLEYEYSTMGGHEIWYALVTDETILSQEEHIKANKVKKIMDGCPEDFRIVTLDVSENVSPELFGIEKVSGYVGNGKYIIYQLKKEYVGKERIIYVIDSESNKIVIADTMKSIQTSVEVYENHKSTLVVVNMVLVVDESIVNKFDVYKKITGNSTFYRVIKGPLRYQLIELFEKLYPIKIDVSIDEEEKLIYEKRKTIESNGRFISFSIRDIDGTRVKNRMKYRFGYIWDKNPYEKGNIPGEEFQPRYIKVRTRVNLSDFMVGNYDDDLYLEEEDRRSYSIVMV